MGAAEVPWVAFSTAAPDWTADPWFVWAAELATIFGFEASLGCAGAARKFIGT